MKLRRLLATGVATVIMAAALIQPASARLDELIIPDRSYEIRPDNLAVQTAAGRYLVREGDSLWQIAQDHRVSLKTLVAANDLEDPEFIRPGQVVIIPVGGFKHLVRTGENLTAIAALYRVPLADLIRENRLSEPDFLYPGQQLRIPGIPHGGPVVPATDWQSLMWPVVGPLTSVFGPRDDGQPHYGIDIAADHGAAIWAAEAGRVIFAGPAGTFGLLVILDHGDGLHTYYAHCSQLTVACGGWVDAGEVIARVGNTGRSFGPHLHFEVRWYGQPFDPMLYLTGTDGHV